MQVGYANYKRRHINETVYGCIMFHANKVKPVAPVAQISKTKVTREQFHKLCARA